MDTKKLFIFGIVLGISSANACTSFVMDGQDYLVYGRNFDWDIEMGFIAINKRGQEKHSLLPPPEKPFKWVSKFGSITFNHVGVDAPMGGMNEKGLVISQMGLPELPLKSSANETHVNELEWIQYQLDTSATVDDIAESLKRVGIKPAAMTLHYLACDSSGNIGIIELIDGKFVMHHKENAAIPVCSNMLYEESNQSIKKYKSFGGTREIPSAWNEIPDIIAMANSMIMDYRPEENGDPVTYSFSVLKSVGSPTRTQWSVVYDINSASIYFKTLKAGAVRTFSLQEFDYSPAKEIPVLNILSDSNTLDSNGTFEELKIADYKIYKERLAVLLSLHGINIPAEAVMQEVQYVKKRLSGDDFQPDPGPYLDNARVEGNI